MTQLITATELAEIVDHPTTRVVDARFDLGDPAKGRRAYEGGHLPGAVYLDLERDLSGPAGEGGRHPLPDPRAIAERLGELGIGDDHRVIAYDDGAIMFAARAWWLLRYLGHERVHVLDGGLPAWTDAGLPLTHELPQHAPAQFRPRVQRELVVDRTEVRARLDDTATLLIDARAPARFRGDEEPIDPVAGHIPGAINLPHAGNVEAGRFKSPEALRRRFSAAEAAREVIAYCGSGVSATVNALAMERAGLGLPRLYVGSWSEWCRDPEAPIATGEATSDR